jgi:hypothetical protein
LLAAAVAVVDVLCIASAVVVVTLSRSRQAPLVYNVGVNDVILRERLHVSVMEIKFQIH